jgi:hypothetical protein
MLAVEHLRGSDRADFVAIYAKSLAKTGPY